VSSAPRKGYLQDALFAGKKVGPDALKKIHPRCFKNIEASSALSRAEEKDVVRQLMLTGSGSSHSVSIGFFRSDSGFS
jgi:hypothetical protein